MPQVSLSIVHNKDGSITITDNNRYKTDTTLVMKETDKERMRALLRDAFQHSLNPDVFFYNEDTICSLASIKFIFDTIYVDDKWPFRIRYPYTRPDNDQVTAAVYATWRNALKDMLSAARAALSAKKRSLRSAAAKSRKHTSMLDDEMPEAKRMKLEDESAHPASNIIIPQAVRDARFFAMQTQTTTYAQIIGTLALLYPNTYVVHPRISEPARSESANASATTSTATTRPSNYSQLRLLAGGSNTSTDQRSAFMEKPSALKR